MSSICIFDFILLLPTSLTLLSGWSFFFKANSNAALIKSTYKDRRDTKTNFVKKINYSIFIKYSIVMYILLFIVLFTIHGVEDVFFFNHFFLTEFALRFFLFFLGLAIFLFYIFYLVSFSKLAINNDFFFALFNLFLFLPLIFFSNTFFTLFFLLELNSSLIFYKFISARFFYKSTVNFTNLKMLEKFNKVLPKNFFNVLFFQYWVTFFSTIILILFLIKLILLFGSTEWSFLNLYNLCLLELCDVDTAKLYFMFSMLLVGLFFKIGLTPIHLYKIEVYKGLPFFSLFFYTVFYFFVYFFFVVMLLVNFLASFYIYTWLTIIIFIVVGLFYVLSLLFDINLIKSFFAYSTIINALTFLCVTLVILL